VYGSPYCHYCSDLKTALEEKKIAYVFYDIDTNEVALNEMLAKLNKAKMSTNNLRIPVVDKYGVLYVNTIDFKEFIKKVTKK
jgi:glutaredoxin